MPCHFYAQEAKKENKVIHLEKTVVTATRTAKNIFEVPIRTEVVTATDIQKSQAKNIADALKYIPGLFISESHGKRGQIASIQGFDANRILILINGERQTAPTGSSIDLTQISTNGVERIEIVKGASSALYGSEAMGGVINIITKTPPQGTNFKIGTKVGSYLSTSDSNPPDIFNIYEEFSVNKNIWNLKINSDYKNDKGFDFDTSNLDTDGDKVNTLNLYAKMGVSPNANWDSSLTLQYFLENKKRLYSTNVPGIGVISNQYLEDSERAKSSWAFCYTFNNDAQIKSNLYFESFSDISIEDIVKSPQIEQKRTAKINIIGSEFQFDLPIGKNQKYTFGSSIFYSEMNQEIKKEGSTNSTSIDEIPKGSETENYSLYFQPDIMLNQWWELVPGIRYQYDSDFGSFVAPKFNTSLKPIDDLIIRFGYGVGYRVPNLKERYYFFDHSAIGYQVMGNTDLQPEQSQNFQAGFDYKYKERFSVNFNIFFNHIKNLIDTEIDLEQSGVKGLQVFTYKNIRRAETNGFETNFDYYFIKNIKGSLGYNFLNAIDKDTDKFLTKTSNHQFKIGLEYKIESWKSEILINWVYQSKQYVDEDNTITSPAWNTLDIRWNKQFGKHINCFTGLNNAFDVHRSTGMNKSQDFRPSVGRNLYVGMEYNVNF